LTAADWANPAGPTSVIPPPSAKYYPTVAQELRSSNVMEVNNVLETLPAEDYELVIGEGLLIQRTRVVLMEQEHINFETACF
jgi:hypothetical protein